MKIGVIFGALVLGFKCLKVSSHACVLLGYWEIFQGTVLSFDWDIYFYGFVDVLVDFGVEKE